MIWYGDQIIIRRNSPIYSFPNGLLPAAGCIKFTPLFCRISLPVPIPDPLFPKCTYCTFCSERSQDWEGDDDRTAEESRKMEARICSSATFDVMDADEVKLEVAKVSSFHDPNDPLTYAARTTISPPQPTHLRCESHGWCPSTAIGKRRKMGEIITARAWPRSYMVMMCVQYHKPLLLPSFFTTPVPPCSEKILSKITKNLPKSRLFFVKKHTMNSKCFVPT